MKSVFLSLVWYAAIGGAVITPLVNDIDQKCGKPTKTQDFAAAVVVWPAIIVGAAIYWAIGPESDGDPCTDDSKAPPPAPEGE